MTVQQLYAIEGDLLRFGGENVPLARCRAYASKESNNGQATALWAELFGAFALLSRSNRRRWRVNIVATEPRLHRFIVVSSKEQAHRCAAEINAAADEARNRQ
ncbi:hypothetical protein PZ938_10215 [Luteipulveratus sp. YIM 133132]|uniref:hypothetical protein n=1 Tax=Luteipulveratus flavus TaxID=3031728 RepID=UPI0023B16C6B|nr:hypothetical protein [Luteipulveratus sp. YIM 133132]MDE9365977.1 hypothetical protein [Luteipulveratus sp. YIM 133132]